jgi:maltodextrin utilization protein YvdJ
LENGDIQIFMEDLLQATTSQFQQAQSDDEILLDKLDKLLDDDEQKGQNAEVVVANPAIDDTAASTDRTEQIELCKQQEN